MPQSEDITYMELTQEMVDDRVVADITSLLPQLTSNASPMTREWLDYMFSQGTRLFVAMDDGRIIGTVLLCAMPILVGQKDWIEDVIVDKEYQRRGIGTRLMDMAEEVSRARGAKSINLTSKPERNGARQMYGARGYVIRDTSVFRKTF